MRSREALIHVRERMARKARLSLIVMVAAGVAVSFWVWFFRNLGRSGERT